MAVTGGKEGGISVAAEVENQDRRQIDQKVTRVQQPKPFVLRLCLAANNHTVLPHRLFQKVGIYQPLREASSQHTGNPDCS